MGFPRILTVWASVAFLTSCSGVLDPSKNQSTPISGQVVVGGALITSASWSKQGEIEATLTSVTPTPANGPLAMYLGADSGGNCLQIAGYGPFPAIVNRTVQFGVVQKGNYCLGVYDPGVLTVAVNVAGNFSHP
jgi:hypothetical protein